MKECCALSPVPDYKYGGFSQPGVLYSAAVNTVFKAAQNCINNTAEGNGAGKGNFSPGDFKLISMQKAYPDKKIKSQPHIASSASEGGCCATPWVKN